ncbi:hypothetical protein FQN50_008847 [Emmonsiellopsis sp. PD_5]|nr:hypothetical protein FQN50_008847 [Emmonsiellopsis sp. PD_5]
MRLQTCGHLRFNNAGYKDGGLALSGPEFRIFNLISALWSVSSAIKQLTSEERINKDYLDDHIPDVSKHPCCLDREHYICGDEQTVCGRFAQNALAPATAVAFANGVKIRFGDFKACEEAMDESLLIPDIVAVYCTALNPDDLKITTVKPVMRLVGEAKTPWKHNLQDYYEKWKSGEERQLRRTLGQIAEYMHRFKMRYAFLTTYDFTIFIRHAAPDGAGPPQLYFTQPIPRDALPGPTESSVSIRQFLYYLLHETNHEDGFTTVNNLPLDQWIARHAANVPRYWGPTTPYSKLLTPKQVVQHMSPAASKAISHSGPVELYRPSSGGVLTAILQFNPDQVHSSGIPARPYVEINGKRVEVKVVDYDVQEDLDDDDDRKAGDGMAAAIKPGWNAPSKHLRYSCSPSANWLPLEIDHGEKPNPFIGKVKG